MFFCFLSCQNKFCIATLQDLGQKRFGATSCETCGMVYTAAHPEDEASHEKFHRKYLSSVKFPVSSTLVGFLPIIAHEPISFNK